MEVNLLGGGVTEKTHDFDNIILLPYFSANCEQFFTQACQRTWQFKQMKDNTLLTVCTIFEYNNLLTVSTKTEAVFPKTEFFKSRWILDFFQLKLTFLLTVFTIFFLTQVFPLLTVDTKIFYTNEGQYFTHRVYQKRVQ